MILDNGDAPEVDIVMPRYNAAAWPDDCLEGVSGIASYRWRLLAREDGSQDDIWLPNHAPITFCPDAEMVRGPDRAANPNDSGSAQWLHDVRRRT
jgi:hypothetical protein